MKKTLFSVIALIAAITAKAQVIQNIHLEVPSDVNKTMVDYSRMYRGQENSLQEQALKSLMKSRPYLFNESKPVDPRIFLDNSYKGDRNAIGNKFALEGGAYEVSRDTYYTDMWGNRRIDHKKLHKSIKKKSR